MTLLKFADVVRAYHMLKAADAPSVRLSEWYAAQRSASFLADWLALKATSAVEDYDVIRADLVNRVGEAFMDFVSQSGAVTSFRNAAQRALTEDIPAAAYRGLGDGGADSTDVDPEDEAWITETTNAQRGFMADAFETLKVVRENETATQDMIDARAEVWGQTLDAIYGEAKIRAKKNQLLEWQYGDTDHCDTCANLNGQKHKASWYLSRDYIPGKPGAAMDCHGFRCQCVLLTKDGEEFTL